jgi:sigma-54-interacting transcriptional regulator
MTWGAVDVDASELRTAGLPSTAEWSRICAGRHNVLLEGPLACTEAVLHLLKPHFGEPVTMKRSGAPFEPHTYTGGTVVVPDIAAFSRPDQERLHRWLEDPQTRTQIVCTTGNPLFPLVVRGLFDETLYYRLNVILLQLTRISAQPDRDAREAERSASVMADDGGPIGNNQDPIQLAGGRA